MSFIHRLNEFLLGSSARATLPEHVKQSIKQQQLTSEKLISWAQIFIILVFSALYFASPKTFTSMAKFAPVPWALLSYFIFSLIRLLLSYRNYLPTWFLMLSAGMDITLLMILIWSFHLQYEQPPAFYLKAPTLLYIFIFIALRALRFEAKYVLAVGLMAALGWLSLLFYAGITMPPGTITRNYILYMTSNHILLGAEIDKVVSILLVTLILALVVARGRRLLVRAIAETIAIKDLSKFFAPEIATTIIQSGQNIKPGCGEVRDIAVLHCDIRNFTETAKQMSPALLIKLLTEYQARIVQVIHEHNGSVDKFLGDGILASFNAIKHAENYVADAMRAAISIIAVNAAWAKERQAVGLKPIHIGVTVAAGAVVVGIVGDESRMEYTLIGDAVNVVAKLDKQCKTQNCQALVTEHAFTMALAQGFQPPSTAKKVPLCKVEGITEPVNLVVLE